MLARIIRVEADVKHTTATPKTVVDRFQSRLAHVATKAVPLKKACSPLLTQ
jgi:hypothetical protein